jgi:hypothetical protein
MIFDKICGISEKRFPDLASILNKSRLFHFDGIPEEFLPKEIDPEIHNFLETQFMLPFPCVAIEDKASLVILFDIIKNQRGINKHRYFIDIVRFETPIENFDEKDLAMNKIIKNSPVGDSDPFIVCFGLIEEIKLLSPKKFTAIGRLDRVLCCLGQPKKSQDVVHFDYSGDDLLRKFGIEVLQQHLKSGLRNSMTAMQELFYSNTPNKFILEKRPAKRKKNVRGRILRSHDRPIFTLLTPEEIRKIMCVPALNKNGETVLKEGYERRSHPRTFHSDRFINMKGQTITIPATWVGPSDNIVGNKYYKVRLDI